MKWQAYPKYKDSDVERLGKIPEEWEINRIKHTTYVKGRIGWKGLKSDEFIDEGPYLLTGTDFDKGRINWHRSYHVSEERYKEDPYIQLKENDLLITKDGTIGKVAIVKNLPGKACLNSGIFVTRPTKKEYITSYMYWLLNSEVFSRFIDYTKTGTTISHLYQNVFVEFAFPRPSITEQHTIAAFLDREAAHIDALIFKKERQIELLQEKRVALISHAVTKGLDPNARMKDSGVEWLGKIPEEWKIVPLKFVIANCRNAIKTGPFGSQLLSSEMLEGNIKVYNQQNILYKDFRGGENYINEEKYEEMKSFTIYPNDVIVTTRGTIGHCALFPPNAELGILHPCLMRIQVNQNRIIPEYLAFLIQDGCIVQIQLLIMSNATTIDVIYSDSLKQILLPLPSVSEQKRILLVIEKEVGLLDRLIDKIKESIELLREYRTAIISAAVTGKIDLRLEIE